MQYLIVAFHPLVVKLCGYYHKSLSMEWRDLLSFALSKFIELVYRYNLNSTLFFRTYIQISLRRALRDKVLFDSRRSAVNDAISLNAFDEDDNTETQHMSPVHTDLVVEMNFDQHKEVADKLLQFARETTELNEMEKKVFELSFVENKSPGEVCRRTRKSIDEVTKAQVRIKAVLAEYARDYLV